MHFITKLCFMCLRRTEKMYTVTEDSGILQQFKFVYPEVVQDYTELPRSVCDLCYLTVISFYTLKKRSMKVYHRWLSYIRLLQNKHSADKFGEIQIRIYKSNPNDDLENEESSKNNEDKNQENLFNNSDYEDEEDKLVIDETMKDEVLENEENKLVIDEDTNNKITKRHPLDFMNVVQKQLDVSSNPIPTIPTKMNQNNKIKEQNNKIKELLRCPICPKSFVKKNYIHHFVRAHTKGKQKIPCPFCKKTYTRNYMRRHFRLHFSLNTHTCPICKKQLCKKSALDFHIKNVHKELRSIRCYNCNENFETQDLYRLHLKSQKHKIRCEEASRLTQIEENKNLKSDLGLQEELHSIRCYDCNEDFEDQDLYCLHLKSENHKIRWEEATLDVKTEETNKNCLIVKPDMNKEYLDNLVVKEQSVHMEII